MAIVLTVTHGGQSRRLKLERELVTLGRDPNSAIPLDDAALSRTHCQFETVGSSVFLRDLNSRNGTRVEGQPIQRSRLVPGQIVEAGNARITFEGLERADAEPGLGEKTLRILLRRGQKRPRARDLEEENRRLRQLLGVVRQLVGELDPDRVLASVIDRAIDLTSAERGFLVVFQGDDLSVEVARNFWRKDVPEPEYEISRSIAEEVRRERRTLIVEDASEDERFSEFLSVCALKLRSVLCVPLIFRARVVGVLYLDNRFTRGGFHDEERDIIEAFADVGAIALENSGRFASERRRGQALEEEVRRQHEDLLRARQEVRHSRRETAGFRSDRLVARSPAMRELCTLVGRTVENDLPVLLEGPAGSGREELARIIHAEGPRRSGPFVVLVCAALPKTLAEVELFGHARGAFTGAVEARPGMLEAASGGTLYLDGIDDLDPDVQATFLRVLETGEFRRLGEGEPRRADVRIVAAARRPLAEQVAAGAFRADLYFRLKVLRLRVPPFSERPEDLPELLERTLAEVAPGLALTPRARKALLLRAWPGNLIELRSELRRLATIDDRTVDVTDLATSGGDAAGGPLRDAVAALEARMIREALRRHGGNRTHTARELGLSRLGLRNKMERLGLGPEGGDASGPDTAPPGR